MIPKCWYFKNIYTSIFLIKIKNKKDTGRNYKTNEKFTFTAVSILIQGPTSESENIVTRQEAEEMYECLRKFLNK